MPQNKKMLTEHLRDFHKWSILKQERMVQREPRQGIKGQAETCLYSQYCEDLLEGQVRRGCFLVLRVWSAHRKLELLAKVLESYEIQKSSVQLRNGKDKLIAGQQAS